MSDSVTALSRSVYQAITFQDTGADALAPMRAVVSAGDPVSRDSAIALLARALNDGAPPGQLAARILDQVDVITPFRHQRDPGWALGTYYTRAMLAGELLERARATHDQEQQLLARAAILLPAQEGFLFGGTTIVRTLRRPDFDALSGWTPDVLSRLREIAADLLARSAQFAPLHQSAGRLLDKLVKEPPPGLDRTTVDQVLEIVEQMVPLAVDRADLQWRVTQYASSIANLARARSHDDVLQVVEAATQRWKLLLPDPLFQRWATEVITIAWKPPPIIDFKERSSVEIKALIRKRE